MNTKVICLLLLLASNLIAATNSFNKDAVLCPTFLTGYDSHTVGTAFVCKIDELKLKCIITAHHTLGKLTWNEVPSKFVGMTGVSLRTPNKAITSTSPMAIPGALAIGKGPISQDLAAFKLDYYDKYPFLSLSKRLPQVGETLYIAGRLRGKNYFEFIPTVVVKSNHSEINYVYKNSNINTGGLSGAPVVNSKGMVVAVHIGKRTEGYNVTGLANPCTSVLKLLKIAK